MINFFVKMGAEFCRQLPCATARILLIVVTLGAGYLHFTARKDIEELKLKQATITFQQTQVLASLQELIIEVRGYRTDILLQNQEMRKGKQ